MAISAAFLPAMLLIRIAAGIMWLQGDTRINLIGLMGVALNVAMYCSRLVRQCCSILASCDKVCIDIRWSYFTATDVFQKL
ncbi:hypothetical protein Tco_0709404 [Tanacetum coccineum]